MNNEANEASRIAKNSFGIWVYPTEMRASALILQAPNVVSTNIAKMHFLYYEKPLRKFNPFSIRL
jgi:hypothetical protein